MKWSLFSYSVTYKQYDSLKIKFLPAPLIHHQEDPMNQEYSHNHKHQESFIIHHQCIAVSSILFQQCDLCIYLIFLGTQGHPYQYVSTCTPSQYGTISSVQPSSTPARLDYWYRLHLIKLNLLQPSTLSTICTPS